MFIVASTQSSPMSLVLVQSCQIRWCGLLLAVLLFAIQGLWMATAANCLLLHLSRWASPA